MLLDEHIVSMDQAHTIISNLPLGLVIWNKDFDLIAYNDILLDVMGLNVEGDAQHKEDYLRSSLDLRLCGAQVGLGHDELLDSLMRDGNVTTTWQHWRPDGMLVDTQVTIAYMLYQGEKAHVAYFQALSFRQTVNANVRDFAEDFEALYASNILGVSVWDNTFAFIDCNARLLNMLEIDSKEELARSFHKYSPVLQPCGASSYTLALDNNKKVYEDGVANFEWLHTTSTGKDLYIKVHSERILYQGKAVALCIVQDATVERALKRELSSVTERLHSMLGYMPQDVVHWNVAQTSDTHNQPEIHIPSAPHVKLHHISQGC